MIRRLSQKQLPIYCQNIHILCLSLAPIATENVNMEFMSDSLMMLKLHALSANLPSISGSKINFLSIVLCMITIGQNAKIIVWLCVTF